MDKCQVKLDTPIGVLRIIADGDELLEVRFPNNVADLVKMPFGDVNKTPFKLVVSFLEGYFNGDKGIWKGELISGSDFQRKIWEETRKIPFGQTVSYGELARHAGKSGSGRAVGTAMARNPLPLLIPCHRVIGSDGGLHGFGGGLDVKKWLLRHEGVNFDD